MPPQVVQAGSEQVQSLPGQWRIAGWSVEHRPIMLKEYGSAKDVILILAGIHGDETAGTALLEELARYLDVHPEVIAGHEILVVPKANPDGMAASTRQNSRGVDINRNFPAFNRSGTQESGPRPLSEPESWAIWQIIWRYRPGRIITIHQPLGCIDYDGPGQDLAEAMAQLCGLQVRRLGSRPGSLGSYNEQIGNRPIITMELPQSEVELDGQQLWAKYGKALIKAIQWQQAN